MGQNGDVRREAGETIAKIVEKGDQHAIASVAARLEHQDRDVRRVALETLAKIVEKRDEHAITAVAACLEDGSGIKWAQYWETSLRLWRKARTNSIISISNMECEIEKTKMS